MNLTAAVVSVIFVGLVSFQGSGTSRNVFVPLAITGIHKMKTLDPHTATLVIKGLKGGKDTCDTLGTWNDGSCTIALNGQTIELPSGTPTPLNVDDSFKRIPHLTPLCAGIGLPKAGYADAATVSLTQGKLEAYTDGDAWISKLTLNEAAAEIKVDGETLFLTDTPTISIINAATHPHDSDQDKHFWWYYTMFNGTETCGTTPGPISTGRGRRLPERLARAANLRDDDAASGAGCSNTNYP